MGVAEEALDERVAWLPAAQRKDKIIGRREEKDFGGGGTS